MVAVQVVYHTRFWILDFGLSTRFSRFPVTTVNSFLVPMLVLARPVEAGHQDGRIFLLIRFIRQSVVHLPSPYLRHRPGGRE